MLRSVLPLTLTLLVLLPFVPDAVAAPRAPRAPRLGDVPLDRYFHGEIVELRGRKITLRYDFSDPDQLKDFYYHRPFPREGTGRFVLVDGKLLGMGGGGYLLQAAFEPDIVVSCDMTPGKPARDVGLFLQDHKAILRSTLYVIRETFFSRRDGAEIGNNMILELGSEGNPLSGVIEFRYVVRSPVPMVDEGTEVAVRIEKQDKDNILEIGKSSLSGKDYGTPLGLVEPGLFVNGGRATYDNLVVTGTLDSDWMARKGVALFLENDLEHPVNRLKRPDKLAIKLLQSFREGEAAIEEVLTTISNPKLIVFLREQVAAAILAAEKATEALPFLEPLLRSNDHATRIFASRILEKAVDIDFGYGPEADPHERNGAVDRMRDYVTNRDERLAKGQVFLGGAWRTPEELELLRLQWDYARVIETDHFVLTTNVTRERAGNAAALLEAGYAAFGEFLGKEPKSEDLPIRVYLFAKNEEYAKWCEENGQAAWKDYFRLVLPEENLGLTSWQFQRNEGLLNVIARLYHRGAIGVAMPLWYEEGFAAYFSWLGAYSWTRAGLRVGLPLNGNDRNFLKASTGTPEWLGVKTLIRTRTKDLSDKDRRRRFYLESWALIAFLTHSDEYRDRWSEFVARCRAADLSDENRQTFGNQMFLESFEGKVGEFEKDWIAWIKSL